LTIMARSATG